MMIIIIIIHCVSRRKGVVRDTAFITGGNGKVTALRFTKKCQLDLLVKIIAKLIDNDTAICVCKSRTFLVLNIL